MGVEVDPEQWHGIDPPGIWPVHCVQGTPGAELHAVLDQSKVDLVIDKAQDRYTQGYSAFHRNDLAALLRERDVDHVYVAGLATDYCVKNTVLDAVREGFGVTVVIDAIRGIDVEPGDSERAVEEMRAAGADFVTSAELLAAGRGARSRVAVTQQGEGWSRSSEWRSLRSVSRHLLRHPLPARPSRGPTGRSPSSTVPAAPRRSL